MTWPLITVLLLALVTLIWVERGRQVFAVSMVVVAAALAYAWLNLGKV